MEAEPTWCDRYDFANILIKHVYDPINPNVSGQTHLVIKEKLGMPLLLVTETVEIQLRKRPFFFLPLFPSPLSGSGYEPKTSLWECQRCRCRRLYMRAYLGWLSKEGDGCAGVYVS